MEPKNIKKAYEIISVWLGKGELYNNKEARDRVKGMLESMLDIKRAHCDEANNSPEVIDNNMLIARIDYGIDKYRDLTWGPDMEPIWCEIEKQETILRNDYELYMKIVTDNFIKMQSNTMEAYFGHRHEAEESRYVAEWEDGLEWKISLPTKFLHSTIEEIEEHNAKVAMKYLQANTLTFSQWKKKFEKE